MGSNIHYCKVPGYQILRARDFVQALNYYREKQIQLMTIQNCVSTAKMHVKPMEKEARLDLPMGYSLLTSDLYFAPLISFPIKE